MKGLRQEDLVDGIPPKPEPPAICARCESPNTKFCYYNNYSVSQPRYYCRDCKRYWTRGGILRNVRVGGKPIQKQPKPQRRARTLDSSHPANVLYYQLFQNRQLRDHHLALIQEQRRQQEEVLQQQHQQQRRSTLQPLLNLATNYTSRYRDAVSVVSTNIQNSHPIPFNPSLYSPAASRYPNRDQNFHIPSFTPHQQPPAQYLVDQSQQDPVVGVNRPRLSPATPSNGERYQNVFSLEKLHNWSRIHTRENVSNILKDNACAEANCNVSADFNILNNDKDNTS